jgi:hypothetical protein
MWTFGVTISWMPVIAEKPSFGVTDYLPATGPIVFAKSNPWHFRLQKVILVILRLTLWDFGWGGGQKNTPG